MMATLYFSPVSDFPCRQPSDFHASDRESSRIKKTMAPPTEMDKIVRTRAYIQCAWFFPSNNTIVLSDD